MATYTQDKTGLIVTFPRKPYAVKPTIYGGLSKEEATTDYRTYKVDEEQETDYIEVKNRINTVRIYEDGRIETQPNNSNFHS